MTGPTEFLAARLAEKEAAAWAVHNVADCDALLYEEDMAGAAARTPDCDCGYPARVRREVEAGRAILALWAKSADDPRGIQLIAHAGLTGNLALLWAVRQLAAVYSDHPDYDEAWRP